VRLDHIFYAHRVHCGLEENHRLQNIELPKIPLIFEALFFDFLRADPRKPLCRWS
jgi:hypothetical protein